MIYCFGDFELDDQRFELQSSGDRVPVQPKVLDVLLYLVRARDRVVLKTELLEAVWADVVVGQASVSRVIMEARRAIGDELQQVIVTARGRGFRFAGAVVERDRPAAPDARRSRDPTFVGRAAATAAVDARLQDALAGQGSVVWLSGEAGIGKTRMAEEIARRARARDAVVLQTRAHEAPPMPPFWPWAQLLRAATEGRDDAVAATCARAQRRSWPARTSRRRRASPFSRPSCASGRRWQQAAQALTLAREEVRRVDVQLGMARSMVLAGATVAAREAFFGAAILARTFGRPEALAEAALGFAPFAGDATAQGRALLEQARTALAGTTGDAAAGLRVRVDAALGA